MTEEETEGDTEGTEFGWSSEENQGKVGGFTLRRDRCVKEAR